MSTFQKDQEGGQLPPSHLPGEGGSHLALPHSLHLIKPGLTRGQLPPEQDHVSSVLPDLAGLCQENTDYTKTMSKRQPRFQK